MMTSVEMPAGGDGREPSLWESGSMKMRGSFYLTRRVESEPQTLQLSAGLASASQDGNNNGWPQLGCWKGRGRLGALPPHSDARTFIRPCRANASREHLANPSKYGQR
jgi:hypothetical protein